MFNISIKLRMSPQPAKRDSLIVRNPMRATKLKWDLPIILFVIAIHLLTTQSCANDRGEEHDQPQIREYTDEDQEAADRTDSLQARAQKDGNLPIYIDSLLELREAQTNEAVKAKISNVLGTLYGRANQLDSAGKSFRNAASFYESDRDTNRLISAIYNSGIILTIKDSVAQAISLFEHSAALAVAFRDKKKASISKNGIASGYISLDLPQEAMEALRAVEALAQGDSSILWSTYSQMGRAKNKLGDDSIDSVVYFFEKAREQAYLTGDKRVQLMADINAASAAWKRPGAEQEGIRRLEELRSRLDIKEYASSHETILISLIKAALQMKDVDLTKKYLREVGSTYKDVPSNLSDLEKSTILNADIFVERQNGPSTKFTALLDSAHQINSRIYANKTRDEANLNAKRAYLRTLQREGELADVIQQQQTERLQQSTAVNRRQFALLTLSGLLLLGLGLLYLRLRKALRITKEANAKSNELNSKLSKSERILQNQTNELREQNGKVEVLNRELNHRAASQINLAYRLIRNQQRKITDPRLKEILGESETQLLALNTLNRYLVQHEGDNVRLDELFTQIAERLREASPVPFDIELDAEPVEVSPREATANALVLHELITNSIKYAFNDSTQVADPRIQLSLKRVAGRVEVMYADNGPGRDGVVRGTGQGK